jgi:hypothetical protein
MLTELCPIRLDKPVRWVPAAMSSEEDKTRNAIDAAFGHVTPPDDGDEPPATSPVPA